MHQRDLNRAVARATGETVTTISRLGFVPLVPGTCSPELPVLNWDELDSRRQVAVYRPRRPLAAHP